MRVPHRALDPSRPTSSAVRRRRQLSPARRATALYILDGLLEETSLRPMQVMTESASYACAQAFGLFGLLATRLTLRVAEIGDAASAASTATPAIACSTRWPATASTTSYLGDDLCVAVRLVRRRSAASPPRRRSCQRLERAPPSGRVAKTTSCSVDLETKPWLATLATPGPDRLNRGGPAASRLGRCSTATAAD